MIIDIVLSYLEGKGGLEKVLASISNNLNNKGHRVRVFLSHRPKYLEWQNSIPEIYFYGSDNYDKLDKALGYRKILESIGVPDLIIATHTPAQSLICKLAVAYLGEDRPSIVSWIHGEPEYYGGECFLKHADAHIAISSYIGEKIDEYINHNSPVYIIENPINLKTLDKVEQSKQKLKLIYIGKLNNYEKRIDLIFNSLKMLNNNDWELKIIGSGRDEDELKKLAKDLDIYESIEWCEWSEHPWDDLDSVSALLLASDTEGFGLVVVEALGRGIPVIASKCGIALDIIENEKNGWLFNKGNSEELYTILKKLQEGELNLPSGDLCVKSVEKLDEKNIIEKFEEVALKYLKKTYKVILEIEELLLNNKLQETLDEILFYESRFSKNVDFINLKSILAIKMGEYEIAIKNLEKAIMFLEEENLDIYYNLAYAYEKNKDFSKAIDIYNQIIDSMSEDKQLEIMDIIENISKERDLEIKNLYNDEKYCDKDECVKIILDDTFYKKSPRFPNDIYEGRKNLNKIMVEDGPLVSIFVLAYNNLEKYTKGCIESILKYTMDIDYELLLVDNGSNDGTYEYFKSINYSRKKIIKVTKNLGLSYPNSIVLREMKGKYLVTIPNDVVVTKYWLSNMVKCAESDVKIGMVNPVLDFVYNNQSVDLKYEDLDDMQLKAASYNLSDSKKWHERLKLVTLGTLYKKECLDIIGFSDYGFIHHYIDDDISFRVRRAGYKTILCKDTFISHRGGSLDKGKDVEIIGMEKGAEFFKNKYYGIDPRDALNYEQTMISFINPKELTKKDYKVLGIDTLCGTPLLEVKNKLRESGIFDVSLSAFSSEAKYWLDLSTICDDVVVDRIEYIDEFYTNKKFDYIIVAKEINKYSSLYKLLNSLYKLIVEDGSIFIKLKNSYDIKSLLHILNISADIGKQDIKTVDLNILNDKLNSIGFFIKNIQSELHLNYDENKKLASLILNEDRVHKDRIEQIYVNNYIIEIKKRVEIYESNK